MKRASPLFTGLPAVFQVLSFETGWTAIIHMITCYVDGAVDLLNEEPELRVNV